MAMNMELRHDSEDVTLESPQLEVGIYQIVDDSMLKENRPDGTGWEWCWADWQRDWMDATPNRYAYRCLPLTIANQTGWWIKNPVGFTATWRGTSDPESIDFQFDASGEVWKDWINSQFGIGIITWNTPLLFRTKPRGSRLLVCGPANYFKANAHPLTALIESDWVSMSFTMNWKIMVPHQPVRFDAGEPLFQAIPLLSNACADLERASVTYQKLADDPETCRSYREWDQSRRRFHDLKASGEVKPDQWQKDYFRGRDATGRPMAPDHMTKLKPPTILHGTTSLSGSGHDPASHDRSSPRAGAPPERPAAPESIHPPAVPTAEASRPAEGPRVPEAQASGPDAGVATHWVDDEWRRWIAENLMLESPPESILDKMIASGVLPRDAASEIELALKSPYIQGVERLRNRLKKRDWLLAVYRKIQRLSPASGEVERRHKLSRSEFLGDYYSTNRPVIISGMMDDWPAMRTWDLDYFSRRFGDRVVEVQLGRNADEDYEIQRERFIGTMPFAELIEKLRSSGVTNDYYMTANNNSVNKKVLPELWDDIIPIPEYLDGSDRLAGFFWLGPAGTITPFHHDLTNNLLAQVIGRKRVKLTPSWDMPLMENLYHVYSRIDGRAAPPAPLPPHDQPQILECILAPGEVLFLPIGCMHFVEGIEISATVSFTNFLFDNDFSSFYSTYHGV